MFELVFPAKREKLDMVIDFINEKVDEICSNPIERATLDIVVEEIFANIASYAYKNGQEEYVKINVEIHKETKEIEIRFEDRGIPFDPLQQEEPNTDVGIMEQKIGGLGIAIVKKSVDKIHYEYKNRSNILTITKKMDV